MDNLFVVLIGLLGGVAVGVQSPMAGAMAQRIGGAASSFVVHLSGAVFSGALLLARGGEGIRQWHALPWYMLASGVFGLILYLTISVTLPRLGCAAMVALIIIGQLAAGLVVDHFGMLGAAPRAIDLSRVAGALLLLAGGYLIVR